MKLLLISSSAFVKKCSTIPPLSRSGLHIIVSSNLPVTRNIWRYLLADIVLQRWLRLEWTSLLPTDNVDSYWSTWKTYFLQIMEICIPHAVAKPKSSVPGMNHTIKKRNIMRNSNLFLMNWTVQTRKPFGKQGGFSTIICSNTTECHCNWDSFKQSCCS